MSRHPNPTRFHKTFGMNDYYHAGDDWEYPMGHMSLMGNVDATCSGRRAAARARIALEPMANHARSGSPRRICPTPRTA